MRRIQHPGEIAEERLNALPCEAVPVCVTLVAGQSLAQAVQSAFAKLGFDFGYLRIDGASFAPLRFVIPAPSSGDDHAAWYSATYERNAPVRARHAGVHLGQRETQPFLHCHGVWDGATGLPNAGHMLCDDSILSQDFEATGWGLKGAGLVSCHDPETNFILFQPQVTDALAKTNAFLITLRPNQDIRSALLAFGLRHGKATARLEGIGSLVGTVFCDGQKVESYATEILILDGQLQDSGLDLRVASVGFEGRGYTGRLAHDENAVCVTAEILVLTETT
ncbi:MAG: hypothetical protein ACK4GC_03815 [Paracoccaceae bacterium]